MLRQMPTALAVFLLCIAATPLWAADEAPKRASLGEVWAVAYSPDGRTLATGSGNCGEKGKLVLWDVFTGKARVWLPQPLGVRSLAFSLDGEKIAVGGCDNKVLIYEARTAKLLATLKGHNGMVNSVAFSSDGKTLASASQDKIVIVWDVVKGAEMRRLSSGDWILCLTFFPDGKSLVMSSNEAAVRIWDVETGMVRQTLQDPAVTSGLESVAVSPDGKTIAVGSWDHAIYLWDVEKGAIRTVLHGHTMSVLSVAFSADGKTLASADGDYNKPGPGEVRLWSMPEGAEQGKWIGHVDSIWGVRFAPDGRTLATVGRDQKVKIWETATGKERAVMENGQLLFEAYKPPALTEKELDEIWTALAGTDGAAAQLAIGRLVRAPDQAAPWLAKRLKPAPKADARQAKTVQEWVKKLDDDDFDMREKAVEELAKMGAAIRSDLKRVLDETSSAEVRQRISSLLEKPGKPATGPEDLRGLRALEALELIHTDAAKELLKGLAEGAPEASLTREAAASCRRLAKRP